jgi:putative ABC transport system permease protein
MSFLAQCKATIAAAIRRRRMERDMADELAFHIATRADDLERDGRSRAEAERQARVEFGHTESLKEDCRQALGLRLLDETWQDLRYVARIFRKNAGFTAVAVLTLAVGIGANTAIFSFLNAFVLNPVPFPHPDRLVAAFTTDTKRNLEQETSPADFFDWQRQNQVFDEICAFYNSTLTLMHENEPEQLLGAYVSPGFFSMLGVSPLIGHGFTAQDEKLGAPVVALLSYDLWHSRFSGDAAMLGRTLLLNGQQVTVIGVLPPNFQWPLIGDAGVWMPAVFSDQDRSARNARYLGVTARLRPGVTLEGAKSFLQAVGGRLAQAYPVTNAKHGASLRLLGDQISRQGAGSSTWIVFGLVACVLLIACANVANLLTGRAVMRRKEMGVRLAIGGSRWRLLRQLLTESLALFLLAGATSVLFAAYGLRWIERSIPDGIRPFLPNHGVAHLDTQTLLYTFLIALVTGLIFGFAPALDFWRIDLNHALRSSTARSSSGSSGSLLRNSLVILETSLALVVLIASGLLVRGLVRSYGTSLGFNSAGVTTAQVVLSDARYADAQKSSNFFDAALVQVRAIPGVKSAGAADQIPYDGMERNFYYAIDGQPAPAPADRPLVRFTRATPGYLETMEIPHLRGRTFSAEDRADSPPVAVINESMAARHWRNRDPIGQRIRYGLQLSKVITIVGVISDTRGLNQTDVPEAEVLVPQSQAPVRSLKMVVRADRDSYDLTAAIRAAVRKVQADQPVFRIITLNETIYEQRSERVIIGEVTGFFAAVALFLSALGIYAVMAWAVAARKQEMGIRMAMGATRANILSLVVGQGLKLSGVGLAIGLVGSIAATRLLRALLSEVSPTDPVTFASVTLLMLLVATLACYIPARRAGSVDPARILHDE